MRTLVKPFTKFICAVLFIFLFTLPSYPADLDKPYSPTRKEQLEISIFWTIKIRTDVWRQRIGFLVWVREKENTIFITLTSANGEEPLRKKSEQIYVEIIKNDVEALLREYEWAKNLKVFVQFS